jgi:hypothetical protein
LVEPRSWTCGFISRADVADFLVKQMTMIATSLSRPPVIPDPARIRAVRENLNEAHVFITERGGPMTTVGFHHLIRPLGEAAGIPSRCARTC